MKSTVLGILLCIGFAARAQKITQITPSNIEFRGISMGDQNHSMCVGDSATIVLNTTSNGWTTWTSKTLPAPCDKTHTFYGVSYYSSTRAAIVGDNGLIFTTANQGTSWGQSGAGITNQTLRAITHVSTTLIAVGDSGIVLRSIDSGKTWNQLASSTTRNINAISISGTGTGYFVGEHGLLGKTTDFGATWPIVTDTARFGYRATSPVTLRGVAISNHDSVVAVGDSGAVGISTNGISWSDLKPGQLYASPLNPSLDSLLKRTSFKGISYSTFGGGNYFSDCWSLFSESDILCGTHGDSVDVSRSFALAGDADGGTDQIAWRYDCGICFDTVVTQSAGVFGSLFVNTYAPPFVFNTFLFASIDSLGYGFGSGPGGVFLKTTNNGVTWNYPNSYYTYDPTDIYTIDSKHAFAVGWSGAIFHTSDGGFTWDSANASPNLERLHSIGNPAKNVFVVCGDYGTIIRSTDGAKTWKPESVSTKEFLESIAFSSSDTGVAIGTKGEILRTTDQGITWSEINNPLTGSDTSYRQVQAFPSGIYYATTDSAGLYRSIDHGQNWNPVPNAPQTISEGFYNDHIGVIAESAWSSALVNDTMRFAFTRDGFATPPIEWTMPIVSHNRMVFHFLDSNTFLCLGSNGFVVKVDMSLGTAGITQISGSKISNINVYPNPSSGGFRVGYTMKSDGPVTIQLFSEDGKDMGTLFNETEATGKYEQALTIPSQCKGTYLVKVSDGSGVSVTKLSIP